MLKCEKETIINFDASSNIATIYTRDEVQIRRLKKLVEKEPEIYRLVSETNKDDYQDATFEVDKKFIKFGKPIHRSFTDEQREAARQRLAIYRKMKKERKNNENN